MWNLTVGGYTYQRHNLPDTNHRVYKLKLLLLIYKLLIRIYTFTELWHLDKYTI